METVTRSQITEGLRGAARRTWRFLGSSQASWELSVTFALTVLTVEAAILSLESADWISPRPSLPVAALVGLLLALGATRAPRWNPFAHLLALAVGAIYLLAATVVLVPATSWEGQLLETLHRFDLWSGAISSGGVSSDRLPLALALAAVAWLTGYSTAYLVLRFPSVWALLPSGLVLLSNLTYLPEEYLPYLFFYLFAAALLLAHLLLQRSYTEWRTRSVEVRGRLGVHFLHYAVWFSIFVFGLAYLLPTLGAGPGPVRATWNKLRSPVSGLEDQIARVFAAVPGKKDFPLYTFGGTLPFLGEIHLSNRMAYTVDSPVRSYWRGRTYDVYQGWGWENAERVETRAVSPRGDILPLSSYPARSLVEITVIPQLPTRTLIYAGEPVKISVAAETLTQPAVAGAAPPEVVSLRSRDLMGPQNPYTVQVLIPIAEERELGQGEQFYPRWVRERYLQIPDTLPRRVSELAQEVTTGAETLYAKAQAIQNYLRQVPYAQAIEAPPIGADGVDHFLFTLREGYSNYHASAMTVLLRSIGIPARLVTGFLPGEYDPGSGLYLVRETHSHAWTEVYFPRYGWIPFEPTNAQPLIDRGSLPPTKLEGDTETEELFFFFEDCGDNIQPCEEGGQVLDMGAERGWPVGALALVLAGAFAILAGTLTVQRLIRPLIQSESPVQTFARLVRVASLLGLGPRHHESPYQYGHRLQQTLPEHAFLLQEIVHRYALEIYGRRSPREPPRPVPWGRVLWAFLLPALKPLARKARLAPRPAVTHL